MELFGGGKPHQHEHRRRQRHRGPADGGGSAAAEGDEGQGRGGAEGGGHDGTGNRVVVEGEVVSEAHTFINEEIVPPFFAVVTQAGSGHGITHFKTVSALLSRNER